MQKRRPVIAVIDDNPALVAAIDSLLSSYGYDTELYGSAAAFLKAEAQSIAVCLIVDVQLGDSCGIELVRQLKERGSNFQIIYVTGSGDQTAKRRAEETGCVAFLRKPFSTVELIEALTKAIE